VPDNFWRGWP